MPKGLLSISSAIKHETWFGQWIELLNSESSCIINIIFTYSTLIEMGFPKAYARSVLSLWTYKFMNFSFTITEALVNRNEQNFCSVLENSNKKEANFLTFQIMGFQNYDFRRFP